MGTLTLSTSEYTEDQDHFNKEDLIDLYENAPCGFLSLNALGVIIRINQTFADFLQKDKAEIETVSSLQDYLTFVSRKAFNQLSLTQNEMELEFKSPHGKIHFFHVKIKRVNQILRLSLVDISEQKKWCSKLKTTSNFGLKVSESLDYRETLNNIMDTVCSQLADGCLIDVFRNQNLMRAGESHHLDEKKILMMSALKGKLLIDAVMENKVVIINDMNDPTITASYKDEIRLLKNLEIQSLVIIPLVLAGRKIGAISFLNTEPGKVFHEDRITLLKGLCTHVSSALERSRLHESVATEARNRYDLISLASHKIRTPLTSLKLQLQTSLKKIAASNSTTIKRAEVERFLDRLNLYMNNISESVDNMINLNEINQKIDLHKERINLRDMVFEVERSLIEDFDKAKCDVTLWADTDVWPMVDPSRIKKVIEQIFVHAMKSGEGQPISITLSRLTGYAVLNVKDCGQKKATGLGSIVTEGLRLELRLSTTIIEEHGGFIEVESDKDGGNSILMYLPI